MPLTLSETMRRLVVTRRATLFAALLLAPIVISCGGDVTRPVSFTSREIVSITIALQDSVLEPEASVALVAVAVDGAGRTLPQSDIRWFSSNAAVATVEGRFLIAHVPGEVTITAYAGSRSSRVPLKVSWEGHTLDAFPRITTMEVNTTVRIYLLIEETQAEMELSDWTSSDPGVVAVVSRGVLAGVAPGASTITARYQGLETSFEMRVFSSSGAAGFGYAYTGDVPYLEPYDAEYLWSAAPNLSYTTSGIVSRLTFNPPYPTQVDFGWLRAGDVWSSLILHAVSLGEVRCSALNYIGFIHGAVFSCGTHMEAIAASPDAFSGTVALVRPGLASTTTTNIPVAERYPGPGMTEYTVPGNSRDEMYWFITPAKWVGAAVCALLPASATSAQASATATCLDRSDNAAAVALNAIGFGTDAARAGEARVFAEFDAAGFVLRRSESGIEVTAARLSNSRVAITLSGGRVGSYSRAPAIFLTAVSSNPTAECWMTQPVGMGSASISTEITCNGGAEGFLFGAMY